MYIIQGYLIHIDFGFMLSNVPGKGIEIEKDVPFKLISDYIELLGGQKSKLFQLFRKLFFKYVLRLVGGSKRSGNTGRRL
jgi:phosphatidylinositol 4-kinase